MFTGRRSRSPTGSSSSRTALGGGLQLGIGDAHEGTHASALRRCAKHIGIWLELWDHAWCQDLPGRPSGQGRNQGLQREDQALLAIDHGTALWLARFASRRRTPPTKPIGLPSQSKPRRRPGVATRSLLRSSSTIGSRASSRVPAGRNQRCRRGSRSASGWSRPARSEGATTTTSLIRLGTLARSMFQRNHDPIPLRRRRTSVRDVGQWVDHSVGLRRC